MRITPDNFEYQYSFQWIDSASGYDPHDHPPLLQARYEFAGSTCMQENSLLEVYLRCGNRTPFLNVIMQQE